LKPAAKPSLCRERQAAKSPSPAKSATTGDSVDSNLRKDAAHAKPPPSPATQQNGNNSFSHALLVAGGSSEKNAAQDKESHLEAAPSKETPQTSPAAAEKNPAGTEQQQNNSFTHALLLGDGSTKNGVPATQDNPANAPVDMYEPSQQTPQDKIFQSDNILNAVELELIWLGEESMYCLSCPEFQFDFIYEYATPALKVELRQLSQDAESETEKLKQIVRFDDWLVARRFDFVRKDIRIMLRRGFRREYMGTVIAELRLLRRQQSDRRCPSTIRGLGSHGQ
jgi:hypothetical protein